MISTKRVMQPEKSTGRKKCAMVKNNGSGIQTDLSLTLLLLFHSCETIGKVLNFSEPVFSDLKSE